MGIKEDSHTPSRLAIRHAAGILDKLALGTPLARIEALGPSMDLSDLLMFHPHDLHLRMAAHQLNQIAKDQLQDPVDTAQAAVLAHHVRRLAEGL